MIPVKFKNEPLSIVTRYKKPVYIFSQESLGNQDDFVVKSFGEEWDKFNDFSDKDLQEMGDEFFDIVNSILTKDIYAIDIGCGSGRWIKYLSDKLGFIEAVDPSDAIFVADKLLRDVDNVRLSKAASDNLPFYENTFDFGMSVGVLHHIPDTFKALKDCVKMIKPGGYFYVYLYYNFENRGIFFKSLFTIANFFRKRISLLAPEPKKAICEIIAVTVYMPFVLLSRLIAFFGLLKMADLIPLSGYRNKSFYIIRNDALDRFGTALEQRFSKKEIEKMMLDSGLHNIIFSNNIPYYHAIGQKL